MRLILATNNGVVLEEWDNIEERICGIPDTDITHDLNRAAARAVIRRDVKVVHHRKHDKIMDLEYVSWKEVPVEDS